MSKRTLTIALLAGVSWLSQASAHAGELTLFSRPQFSGAQLSIDGPVRDLTQVGFNDRASSMVIRSGRWEVCEHADFRGQCVVLERGEYAGLSQLNDRISSVREVSGDARRGQWDQDHDRRGDGDDERRGEWDHDRRGEWDHDRHDEQRAQGAWNGGRGDGDDGGWRDERQAYAAPVEMFTGAEFGGQRVDLRQGVVPSMRALNMNDRAKSIVIHAGQWEFCQHDDFDGECQVFGPGRYPHLGRLSSQISSMRRVR